MLRPPSIQREYDEYYSRDPAFAPPALELEPKLDETGAPSAPSADEVEAHAKMLADHAEGVRIARETGQWSTLATDGTPTKFVMRPIPGKLYRRALDELVSGRIGPVEFPQLCLRLALVRVENLGTGAPGVKLVKTERYGAIASDEICDFLDAHDLSIVRELGDLAAQRAKDPDPKS